MRITTLLSLAASLTLAGCTVKDVDAPPLAGPSTLSQSIVMVADRNTLTQNGVDFTDIRITALGPAGQSLSVPLLAQVFVDNVAADFGTLSTKTPTTPTTVRYTAPAASTLAVGQVPTTVTIAVTPANAGDFRGEMSRQLDIRLLPQGVIVPVNPNLAASFDFSPAVPEVLTTVNFNAGTSSNNGTACNQACLYNWDFGDRTTGTGLSVTHQYRTATTFIVQLTVTDSRGAQAMATKSVSVSPGTPPTPAFTFSPTPALVEQTIFFNATASRAASGRTIVSYEWDFGSGRTGTGVAVTKSYDRAATYTVTLKVTDDAGAFATTSQTVVVTNPQIIPAFTVLPSSPLVGDQVSVNASSTTGPSAIVTYSWNFGIGSSPTTGSGVTAVTSYSSTGNKVITLTVTDSAGRTATTTRLVTVQ